VPSASDILEQLTVAANQWRGLAILWHIACGAMLAALAFGWRPSSRMAAGLLVAPLASVSAIAWVSGNPFNGLVFAVVAAGLGVTARRMHVAPVHTAHGGDLLVGAGLVVFGWCYPHFLAGPAWAYAYAAPLGVIPCPTLSALVSLTLLLDRLGSRAWSATLSVLGIAYGLIGAAGLGVTIDLVLLGGALWLLPRRRR
jgi:hypothetical protein